MTAPLFDDAGRFLTGTLKNPESLVWGYLLLRLPGSPWPARYFINPDFIPTAALRKKFSFGQPEGFPTLKLCFLAYIPHICGAAKFSPHLGFG